MKNLIAILFLSVVFIAAGVTDNINNALKTGNSSSLATNFSKSIDLTILDKEAVYSKAQAEIIVKNFFAKNKPTAFTVAHEGKSKDGSKYVIGDLKTNKGNFRVHYFLKETNKKFQIYRLNIENDEE